jgi:hypothetical protein
LANKPYYILLRISADPSSSPKDVLDNKLILPMEQQAKDPEFDEVLLPKV